MPASGASDQDLFRLWLEGQRAFLDAGRGVGPAWERARTLHRTWSGFLSQIVDVQMEGLSGLDPFDPAGWMRPEGAGGMADLMRWLEGPELADLWPEERRAIRTGREWMAWLAAMEQMQGVCGQTWLAAFKRFAARLSEIYDARREAGEAAPDGREIHALWTAIAEEVLTAAYGSPAWLKAQRELLRTATDLRAAIRERIERISALFGLPTRAEVDDLHQTLHEMRREVRRLRRDARREQRA